jgi:hypothetical protein
VQHFARVLVSPSQATSLLTAGASGLRAVKEGSGGAYVKVLQPEDTPFCALDGDRVTQISGGPVQVRLFCKSSTGVHRLQCVRATVVRSKVHLSLCCWALGGIDYYCMCSPCLSLSVDWGKNGSHAVVCADWQVSR